MKVRFFLEGDFEILKFEKSILWAIYGPIFKLAKKIWGKKTVKTVEVTKKIRNDFTR